MFWHVFKKRKRILWQMNQFTNTTFMMFKPFWIEWVNWKIVLFDWITANSGEINKWHHVTLLALDVLRWPPVKTGQLALGHKLYCSSYVFDFTIHTLYINQSHVLNTTPPLLYILKLFTLEGRKKYIFLTTRTVFPHNPNPIPISVWCDSANTPWLWRGLSFSSERWWGRVHRRIIRIWKKK